MSGLDQAQHEWLELFYELRSGPGIEPDDIAAPFLSVPPANYDPVAVPSVLYVGNATAGSWYRESFLESPTVHERRARTAKFLDEEVKTGCYTSAFWDFAMNLSAQAADRNANAIETLQNIVWTNITKIGQCSGNPRNNCFDAQRELAMRTLRLEIREYRPRLVVFVTGDYGDDIVGEITGDPEQTHWRKEQESDGFWWRPSMDGMPAIFWSYHPQYKPRKIIDAWLEMASVLAAR